MSNTENHGNGKHLAVMARYMPVPTANGNLCPRKAWKLLKVLDWLDNKPIEATKDITFLVLPVMRLRAHITGVTWEQ